ncbi:MAG: hypothetical protein OJF51_001180 [Nitrospira sp.]|nr:MAG: hypothetical protein OJF51_001180 [Nitrospira sp.]
MIWSSLFHTNEPTCGETSVQPGPLPVSIMVTFRGGKTW